MNAIVKNIPNSITCLNLLSGCFACIFAFQGQYDWVALCIGLSALFDFLDGMAARLLHAYSPLGKELDSLADLISFGLAPGLMVMHLMAYNSTFHGMAEYQSWWALSALLIPVFSALRLAKFNIDTRQTTSFIGLPVPANALFWIGICQAVLRMESPVCGYAIVALVMGFVLERRSPTVILPVLLAVVLAAVAAVLNGYCTKDKEITVKLKGGDLKIKVTDEAIYLTGDAVTVFNGSIII